MRFIENEGKWRRLQLTVDDLDALRAGASIGDGQSVIVTMASPIVLKTWVMRTEVCARCDRPELCAVIKAGSARAVIADD